MLLCMCCDRCLYSVCKMTVFFVHYSLYISSSYFVLRVDVQSYNGAYTMNNDIAVWFSPGSVARSPRDALYIGILYSWQTPVCYFAALFKLFINCGASKTVF